MNAAFEALKAASPEKRGIDILIHNAGYFPSLAPIGDVNANTAEYWSTFETNVHGSYITTRAFLSTLRPKDAAASHEPTLIALSTAGVCFFPPPPGFSAYATSMVAKARFFECVAAENPDLRVHNVHPGAVDTEMGKKAADQGMKLPLDDG
jgi:NAD(P)-dependent dehydrogenase (short-subunit alcohol dehydrogenase family)